MVKNAQGIHIPLHIPLEDQTFDHLIDILVNLQKIIDKVEKCHCCALVRRDLDKPNAFYEFQDKQGGNMYIIK